jgi:hypothetical protein
MNRPSLFRTHAMGGVSIASFKTGSILSTAGLLMSLAIAPPSIAQTIETVAGTGVYGYNGEDSDRDVGTSFAYNHSGLRWTESRGLNATFSWLLSQVLAITTRANPPRPILCRKTGDGPPRWPTPLRKRRWRGRGDPATICLRVRRLGGSAGTPKRWISSRHAA